MPESLVRLDSPGIQAILILDSEGSRIYSRYYDLSLEADTARQFELERQLHAKVSVPARDADMLLHQSHLVAVKSVEDVSLFVVVSDQENELLAAAMLATLEEALLALLSGNPLDKYSLKQSMDLVMLCLDEMVDEGTILEMDPENVASRANMQGVDREGALADQTLAQALMSARDQVLKSFRS